MENDSSRPLVSPSCDFCDERTAVLYCRADSAKLCLFCDHRVHSANALSLKHVRSQICDNCKSDSVTFRCTTDHLLLCSQCNTDAHAAATVASLHHRLPIHGFSGCPPPAELASLLNHTKLSSHDFIVKTEHATVPCSSTACGSAIYQQLVDLARREMAMTFNGDVTELLGPETPRRCCQQDIILANVELDYGDEHEHEHEMLHQQQTPLTSLLMLDYPFEEAATNLWTCNAQYRTPQIWDFCSGRSRSCGDETQPRDKEVGCDPNGFAFTMNNYSNTKTRKTTTITDAFEMNQYSQNGMVDSATKVLGTSIERASHQSQIERERLELVAQNKGNAMVRYLEKKKARRFDKYIRYESRKARADTRQRIKGRFVKTALLDEKSCN